MAWARSCGRICHWDWDGRTWLWGTGQESFCYFYVKGYNCLFYFYYCCHTAPSNPPLTLGPIGALHIIALVCLLQNINADSKEKRQNQVMRYLLLMGCDSS